MAIGNWEYNGKEITSIQDIHKYAPKAWGFVYHFKLFDLKTRKQVYEYIGKKNLYSITNPKITEAEYKLLKKKGYKVSKERRKTGGWIYRKNIIKESNWKTYTSSNKYIKENKNKYIIKREILLFCDNDYDLKYQEAKFILCSGALETDSSLNNGFSLRLFGNKMIEN